MSLLLTDFLRKCDFNFKGFIKGEELKFDPAETAKMEKQIGTSKEESIKTIETAFDELISALGIVMK